MPKITLARTWNWRRDALTTVQYLGDHFYDVTAEVAKAARAAGVLKRDRRPRKKLA